MLGQTRLKPCHVQMHDLTYPRSGQLWRRAEPRAYHHPSLGVISTAPTAAVCVLHLSYLLQLDTRVLVDVLHLQEVCASPAAAVQLLRSLMDLHTALDQQQQEAAAATPFSRAGTVPAQHTGSNWRHDMVNARLTVQQLHQAVHACLAQVVLAAQVALVTAGQEVEQLEAALCTGPAGVSHGNTWAPSVVVSSTSSSSSRMWTAGVSCPTAGGGQAGPVIAAAVEALQQVKVRRSCLAAAVCPRHLQQSSSAAFTALDAAARVGDVAVGLKTALAPAGECAGDMVWAEGVSLYSIGANVKDMTDSSSCPTRPCPAIQHRMSIALCLQLVQLHADFTHQWFLTRLGAGTVCWVGVQVTPGAGWSCQSPWCVTGRCPHQQQQRHICQWPPCPPSTTAAAAAPVMTGRGQQTPRERPCRYLLTPVSGTLLTICTCFPHAVGCLCAGVSQCQMQCVPCCVMVLPEGWCVVHAYMT
jgi:hypothetical protein